MLRCKTPQKRELVSASPFFLFRWDLVCCLEEVGSRLREAGKTNFDALSATSWAPELILSDLAPKPQASVSFRYHLGAFLMESCVDFSRSRTNNPAHGPPGRRSPR